MRRLAVLSCIPCIALFCPSTGASGATLYTSVAQSGSSDWTAAVWTNATITSPARATNGNSYECVSNGVPATEATPSTGTHLRNPLTNSSSMVTFPGDSLKLNFDTALWGKKLTSPVANPILNFPGTNANPGLILNGGILYAADSSTTFTITGAVQVTAQSYISGAGGNGPGGYNSSGVGVGAGGGRDFTFAGQLSGGGNLVIFESSSTAPQTISGNSNSYSGKWIVKAGWLVASGANSLGTNSITIDPFYNLPLDTNTVYPVNGPAILEPYYDLQSAGTLTLTNSGQMNLHQNCAFSAALIEGNSLSLGTHSYSELIANYPANFPSGGSGSLTIQPYNTGAPQIVTQPASQAVGASQASRFNVIASGAQPLAYQWKAGATNSGIYTNLSDGGQISGSASATLTISNASAPNIADYIVKITNSLGSITSSVATLTVTQAAPAIVGSPASQILYTGQTAQLAVIASGSPPLSYQWRAGPTNSGVYTNLADAGNISGSATPNLTITNLTSGNLAGYLVVVTNAVGSATSIVATLIVSPAPPSSTNAIESTLLRLELVTYPFSFRVIEKSFGTVLLQQTANQFTIGSTYTVSAATNLTLTSTTLNADLVLLGTSFGGHLTFNFIQPGIIQTTLSCSNNPPSSILQQFADQGEDIFGALETPFGATLSARGYSWPLLGGNGVSGIDQASGAHAPFYLTTRRYGIYAESQANGTMTFAQDGYTGFSFPVPQLTYDIIYGPDYATIMAGFNSRTVPAFMPPLWAFDSFWWKDDDHSNFHNGVTNAQGNVLDTAIQLTNNQIHASAEEVDRPYGTSCSQYAGSGGWGNMDFDNSFPNPSQMVSSMHSMGYNLMVWTADECWCGLRAPATNNGWAFFPTANNTTVDLSNSNAYHWFQTNLNFFVNLGIKGYKIDRGDEGEMPDSAQNVNDNLFAQLSKEGLNAANPNDWFMYTRSISDIGRQYCAIWNGDTTSLFSGLQYSVIAGLRAGIINFPFWGSDTGGYLIGPNKPTEELFARWLEFSAYCPMMEVLVGGSRTPWYDYSSDFTNPTNVVNVARIQAGAHHDLIPYTRSCLYQAVQAGMPIMRPIMFSYPNDANNAATITNCEYLLGPDILVAPVVSSGATTRSVYLPADNWLDYNTKTNLYIGPASITAAAPVQTIPLFVHQGAIIPRGDIWQGNNNWTPNWSPQLRVEFFPTENSGNSFPYYTGTAVQYISCTNQNHVLTIQFGNLGYSGNVQIYLASLASTAGTVLSNGAPLASGVGYTYNSTTHLLQVPFTGPTTFVVSNAGGIFSPLEAWRAANFGNPSNPSVSSDSADPDGDGIPNILEYAFGLNPLVASTNGVPFESLVSISGTNYLALTFRRATNATDLKFTVMVTDDLLNPWSAGSSYSGPIAVPLTPSTTEISRVVSNSLEIITVRDNVPAASVPRRFMRVRVTNP